MFHPQDLPSSSSGPGMSLWAQGRSSGCSWGLSARVIYCASLRHMSLKLQCPFPAEIISTKSGSYYRKRRADVMIYYYLWSQGPHTLFPPQKSKLIPEL